MQRVRWLRPLCRGVLSLVVASLGGLAAAQAIPSMATSADPRFEVATVKPSDPAKGSSGFQIRGRRVIVLNETLDSMLEFAYGVQRRQIVDEPAWMETEHYDVDGIPDVEGIPNVDQYRAMVRKLLADRFQLTVHREQREMTIYALRVAKGGPKLGKSVSDPEAPQDQTGSGGRTNHWRFTNNSMVEFAKFLQTRVDRPVVDQTGLQGKYSFVLNWASDDAPESDADPMPGMLTALVEQIGLKLEATKGSAEVLAVEHVERPSPN